MTEHLPECCVGKNDCSANPCNRCHACCICEELRACEERVEESMDQAWAKAVVEIEAHARSLALDAAREAVEGEWAEDPSWDGTNWNNALTCALAAIDALRQKP